MIKPLSEKAVHTRIAGRQNLAAASNVGPAFDAAPGRIAGALRLRSVWSVRQLAPKVRVLDRRVALLRLPGSRAYRSERPLSWSRATNRLPRRLLFSAVSLSHFSGILLSVK